MSRRPISLGVLLAFATAVATADEVPAVKPDSAAINELIKQLASDDFATRERATQELSKLEEAPEAVLEATKSNDPEVRRRAQSLVEVIAARAENKVLGKFVQWVQSEDFVANSPHNPLVIEDKVVVGTDQGQLRAYRCRDGKSVWVHQHGARIFHRPSSDGQHVYFSSAEGLTAVKVEDGTQAWSLGHAHCDGPTLPLARRATVLVGGHDGNLYGLDAKTGDRVWVSEFLSDAPPDPPDFAGERARIASTKARPTALTSDGETVFLSVFDQCRVIAVNAADGKRLWSYQTGGWIYGSAVATERHVFVGSQDKNFYCLDKQTGVKVWSYQTKGRIESGAAVDDRFVYFASCDGGLYALNQSDGKPRWRFATDDQKDGRRSAIYSVPVLHRGGVYFGAGEGQAYAVDQHSGDLKWKVRPSKGSEIFSSPATDGTLFFLVTRAASAGQGERSLVALRLQ